MKSVSLLFGVLLATTLTAQTVIPVHPPAPAWSTVSLGQAGEPSVAADGNGHVYVTGHQYNAQSGTGIFYASANWGQTFPTSRTFTGACCDFQVKTAPDGKVFVIYMTQAIDGIMCAVSSNFGTSFYQNKKVLTGPYDREWFDFRTGKVDIAYSDGYIGGPTSVGVFYSSSADNGNSFTGKVRVDNESVGSQPVDPTLISNPDSNIVLVGWNTSLDSSTCYSAKVARSTNGGASFTDHTTIALFNSSIGDTQERWCAQIPAVAAPNNNFYFIYQNYANVSVDGQTKKAFLLFYRRSRDGGHTWDPPKTVCPMPDIVKAIRLYESKKWTTSATVFPYYIQHQPWATIDPGGKLHVVWYDNRKGQQNGVLNSYWTVYHTEALYDREDWQMSDAVGAPFLCVRPNLDFLSVAADNKYIYTAWIKRISETSTGWSFYGNLFLSRRPQRYPTGTN